MSRQSGFTLIEMAFVIVIISLLVGGGLMALGPVIEKTRVVQTNANFDQIENALTLFAIRNNRLPCPADGSLTNASANYGLEVGLTAAGTNLAACNPASYTSGQTVANSVVPWRTLGLDETYSIDGWSNRISYFPANGTITGVNTLVDNSSGAARACPADATGANCTLCLSRSTAAAGSSTRATLCDIATASLTPAYPYGNYLPVFVAGVTIANEATTANPAGAITTATVAQAGGRAAYVLISHGRTGWYGWNKGGTQLLPPNASYVVKKYNSNGSAVGPTGATGFVQGTPVLINGSTAYFDDIVRWRSPAFLIQTCGSGSCGNP